MSKDEANFKFLNSEIWKQNNTAAEFGISTAADIPELNLAITGINDKTTKALLTLNEQIMHVQEGEFEFTLDGKTKNYGSNSVVVIPSNIPHSGIALTDCKIMDVFSPVREEYR